MLAAHSRALTVGLGLALVTFCLACELDLARDRVQLIVKDKRHWDQSAGGVARWLEVYGGPGAIALGDIGEIGYRSGRVVFDILGLVTREVSELPGGYGGKEVAGLREAFFQAAPRYMVVISNKDDCIHPFHHVITAIYSDPRFDLQYAASGRVRSGGDSSWCLFERRELLREVPVVPREVPASNVLRPRPTSG